jgi:hypothetical protein
MTDPGGDHAIGFGKPKSGTPHSDFYCVERDFSSTIGAVISEKMIAADSL